MNGLKQADNLIRKIRNKSALALAAIGAISTGGCKDNAPADKKVKPDVEVDSVQKMSPKEERDAYLMSILLMIEGCTLEAYTDDVGVWTYGIGNTRTKEGKAVRRGDTLANNNEAMELAQYFVDEKVDFIFDYINRDLTPSQKAAITSLAYNCGPGVIVSNGQLTELGKEISKGNDKYVVHKMLEYNKAKGIFMRGLFFRRVLEAYLYQGFITMQDFQKCVIGGMGNVSANKVMRKMFDLTLKGRGRRVTGTYDDYPIELPIVAKKLIRLCQIPINPDTLPKKLQNFNFGKGVSEFLPEHLLVDNKEDEKTAGPDVFNRYMASIVRAKSDKTDTR